jgi:hypothetical protein
MTNYLEAVFLVVFLTGAGLEVAFFTVVVFLTGVSVTTAGAGLASTTGVSTFTAEANRLFKNLIIISPD